MREVKIDREKCTSCLECVEVCPEKVYVLMGNKPIRVYPERCLGHECGLCVNICPEDAISVVEFRFQTDLWGEQRGEGK
ncbi:MAG: 4Fe-4S dicluster domain-containing protein [Candidatus Electrothrix sp. ATG2]|nr:4Fe-4S dicluster domain-containing protein [Candidatus Electrothrix sp. ATG2]